MKRFFVAAIAILAIILQLSSCDGYTSSYSAFMLTRSNKTSECSASFQQLDGSLVFKIKRTDAGEGELNYNSSLDSGSLSVYYDAYGDKQLLFTVSAGEHVSSSGGYVECGKQITVIVEAKEAKGSLAVKA